MELVLFFLHLLKKAAIMTLDGVGEWATTSLAIGQDNQIEQLQEIHFPHSLGLFYSAFTYYCGFEVNRGEYKLMGLAPYANPSSEQVHYYHKWITTKLIRIAFDGSFKLNMKYFDYPVGNVMCHVSSWYRDLKIKPRQLEGELQQNYIDLAFAAQKVTEEVVILMARHLKKQTQVNNLVLAGGVALNCVSNGLLEERKWF